MIKSVRFELLKSVNMFKKTPLQEWIFNHPGQCVLNGSQIHWTNDMEDSINQ